MNKKTVNQLKEIWKCSKDISSVFQKKALNQTKSKNIDFAGKAPLLGLGIAAFAAWRLRANEEDIKSVSKSERSFLAKHGGRMNKEVEKSPKNDFEFNKTEKIIIWSAFLFLFLSLSFGIFYFLFYAN